MLFLFLNAKTITITFKIPKRRRHKLVKTHYYLKAKTKFKICILCALKCNNFCQTSRYITTPFVCHWSLGLQPDFDEKW
jgi:hypothetical protein